MKTQLKLVILVIFSSLLISIHANPVSAYYLRCPPWCSIRAHSINTVASLFNTCGQSVELKIFHGKAIYKIEISGAPDSQARKSAKPALLEKNSRLFGSRIPNPFDIGAAAFMVLTCIEIEGGCCDESGSNCPCRALEVDGQDIVFYYSQLISIGDEKEDQNHCYWVERIEPNEITMIMDEKRFEKACREVARTKKNRLLVDNGLRVELVSGPDGRVGMKVDGINRLTATGKVEGKVTAAIEDLSQVVQFSNGTESAPVRYREWPWSLPCPCRGPKLEPASR
jgi:hypothetical protein